MAALPDPWARFPDAQPDPWDQFPDAETVPAPDGAAPVATKPPSDPNGPFKTGPVAQKPEPGLAQHVAVAAQAALRGVADLAGTPVDLPLALFNGTNWALNKTVGKAFGLPEVPGIDFSLGDTIAKMASGAASAVGAPPIAKEDMTPAEQTLYNPIRFGTSAGLAGGALAARVPGMVERLSAEVPVWKPGDFLVRQYAANPAKTIVGDVASGAGAGVGQDIAEKVAPNSPIASMIGMLAGGTAGAGIAGGLNTAKHGVEAVADRVRGTSPIVPPQPESFAPFSPATVEAAARRAQERATDLPAAKAKLAENTTDLRFGPTPVGREEMPTSGLLSEDPGLISAEYAARITPKSGPKFVANKKEIERGVADRVGALRDPNTDFSQVNSGVAETRKALLDQRDAEALPLLAKAKAAGVQINAQPVADLIDQTLATTKRPAVRSALMEARKSLNAIKAAPDAPDALDTSVEGLYESRKTINDLIAGRGETPTGKYAQSELIAVRDKLDEAITSAVPEFGQYLQKFREGSEPLDAFKASEGVVKLFDGQDPRDVASGLLRGGFASLDRAKEIAATVAKNPEAQSAWKASVAEALYKRVTSNVDIGDNATVSHARLAKEFKDNEDLLTTVFTPEEMSVLRQGHKMLEMLRQLGNRATPGSQTAPNILDSTVGKSFQIAARHLYGNLEAGGIIRNVRLAMDTLPSNRDAIDQLMEMAWFDPELMGYLLDKPLKNRTGAPYNVNLKRALAAAATQRDSGEDGGPTEITVTRGTYNEKKESPK